MTASGSWPRCWPAAAAPAWSPPCTTSSPPARSPPCGRRSSAGPILAPARPSSLPSCDRATWSQRNALRGRLLATDLAAAMGAAADLCLAGKAPQRDMVEGHTHYVEWHVGALFLVSAGGLSAIHQQVLAGDVAPMNAA